MRRARRIMALVFFGTPFLALWLAGYFSATPPPPLEKIDVHTHVSPEHLPAVMAALEAEGVTRLVNLSGGLPGRGLEAQLAAARAFPGRVKVFTNLGWRGCCTDEWVQETLARLREARDLGASGVKISKALGLAVGDTARTRVTVDDPRLDPIFALCGELGLPVAIHTGDPVAFFEAVTPENERYEELRLNPSWSFARPGLPSWSQLWDELSRRIARHPETTFIGVHFGNAPEYPARVGALLDASPNLYIDTAARLGELGRDDVKGRLAETRAVILAHPDRILFGTDLMATGSGWVLGAPGDTPQGPADVGPFLRTHWRFFETAETHFAHPVPIQGDWRISGLGLPRPVLAAIYAGNAERLLFATTPEPRP